MSGYKIWAKKQAGNPLMLGIAAVGFSASFYGTYKLLYAPWAKRNRMAQNEAYANMLLNRKDSGDLN